MRMIALAAAFAGLSLVGTAEARVWTDPAGRLVFEAPNNWVTTQERGANPADAYSYVITGTANNECQVVSQANPGLATATADTVRRAAADETRFTPEFWATTGNGMPQIFPGSSAQVLSTSLDSSGFWPIQRAEIQSPERLVHASIQLRPGFNLIAMCMTYGGADPVDLYTTVSRSVAHPNDATFRADAERQATEREAAAVAPPPPPPEEQGERRRRNRN